MVLPLGELTKDEVRRIAADAGLATANKADSQDFYSGSRDELIGAPEREGNFVTSDGRVVGRHSGFWHFTIGQRKGLGIGGAGEPYYVVELNACRNQVVVGRADEAVRTEFSVTDFVAGALSNAELEAAGRIPCTVKIRSTGRPRGPAFLEGRRCVFPDGIAGVAPGQSVVFYGAEGEILAGGVIE